MPKLRRRAGAFLGEHWAAVVFLLFLLALRLVALDSLGITYSLGSDDCSYVDSGLRFAESGTITMHDAYPSAQIMPGMTVFLGLLSRITGEGALWAVGKVLWCCMGSCTGWFIYRSVTLFAPKWCGLLAMLPLFRADMVWMDNLILTETPFMLALTALVYCTLAMGKTPGWRYFWGAAAAYLLALLLKANIAPYPLLALVYLLLRHYDRKLLLRQCLALSAVVLCFIVPWTLRNALQFHAFIPLTYGAGNPSLLGTYQGTGYPPDEGLDYETQVEQVVRARYAAYYQPDGSVIPRYQRYVDLQRDGVKASYRKSVWWERDKAGMLRAYLIHKPKEMVNSSFYWDSVFGVPWHWMGRLQKWDTCLCLLAAALSLALRRHRAPVFFAGGVYAVNLYIYAMTFAFDRYNASLMSLRFLLLGFCAALLAEGIRRVWALRKSRFEAEE